MKRLVLLLGCGLLLAGAMVQEPSTGIDFSDTLAIGGTTATCTGVNLRTKLLLKIYAVAHYGDPAFAPKETDPMKRLEGWIAADAAKAFVLKFTYTVPKEKMIEAWNIGFDDVQYSGPNRKLFLDVFTTDLPKGTDLRVIASPGGAVSVEKDGKSLGTWKDPALVKALWTIWMGPKTTLSDRTALVAR